jgi:hypothetical protein
MSGADVTATNTAAHTADTPQLLLEHHLKELRLPTMLREYDKVARQCAVEQLDYQRYLLRMTELELLDRERRATERRIRQAKFPVVKTMDSFDFLAIPTLNKALVLELARCEFLARRENVLLPGNSGTETYCPLSGEHQDLLPVAPATWAGFTCPQTCAVAVWGVHLCRISRWKHRWLPRMDDRPSDLFGVPDRFTHGICCCSGGAAGVAE